MTNEDKWISIPIDEQETIINLDYQDKCLHLYTCNQATSKRLQKKIGKPNEIDHQNNLVCGTTWEIKFQDRESIRKALSLGSLITTHQSKTNQKAVTEE